MSAKKIKRTVNQDPRLRQIFFNTRSSLFFQASFDVVAPQPVNITYGYSRDHRPDLKQFILDLICSGDSDVPFFLKVASGNQSDQKEFAQIAVGFQKQIDLDTLMIADSALYSAANISLMKQIKWLCRVPLTVGYAKQLISQLLDEEFVKSQENSHRTKFAFLRAIIPHA